MKINKLLILLIAVITVQGCSNEHTAATKRGKFEFPTDGSRSIELDNQILRGEISVDQRDENNVTPLIYACKSGNLKVARYLLLNGADINYESDTAGSPLTGALFQNHYDIASILIEYGADPDFPSLIPLIFSAIRKGDIEMVFFLVENGSDINQVLQKTGMSPLSYACAQYMLWSDSEHAQRKHKIFVYKHIIDYLISKTNEETKSRVDDDGNTYSNYLDKAENRNSPKK